MNSVKKYFRNKLSPNLWTSLTQIRKKLSQVRSKVFQFFSAIEDLYFYILFFMRKKKGFTSVACLVPFMRLEFAASGKVCPCCVVFTKVKSVGNMKDESIEQIWNGKALQRFRKLLLLGVTRKTCMPKCKYLKTGPISIDDIRTDTEDGALIHDDIRNGRVKLLSHPIRFNLANFTVCNLNCVMCTTRRLKQRNDDIPLHVIKTHENLKDYFDKKVTIYLSGNGDVLARKDTRELLQNFDSKKHNKVSFQIITNGLLFQPEMWETIKHNNYTYANISLDAATKETYAKVRRGANWEKLMSALEVFRKAKEEGKFSSVNLNMTTMRSNYREIPQFIKMARSMGFHVLLTIIRGEWGDENIFELNDEKELQELRTILSDRSLYGKDVDMIGLLQYIPKEFHSLMGNNLSSIWLPTSILKTKEN